MRNHTKTLLVTALAAAVLLSAYLGYTSYRLKKAGDTLAQNLSQVENRNRLLNGKYKEKKAEVGRLQRESMGLKGRLRQAVIDLEKLDSEHQRLLKSKADVEAKFKERAAACETEKARLSTEHEELKKNHAELGSTYRQTTKTLKMREDEIHKLTSQMQALSNNLERTTQQSKRYKTHNAELAKIAKVLVARVEKEQLGTSVLVNEPLIQFKRVEVEKLLQEYLDKIDDEKIMH
jgi:chromosome segregation ATPase